MNVAPLLPKSPPKPRPSSRPPTPPLLDYSSNSTHTDGNASLPVGQSLKLPYISPKLSSQKEVPSPPSNTQTRLLSGTQAATRASNAQSLLEVSQDKKSSLSEVGISKVTPKHDILPAFEVKVGQTDMKVAGSKAVVSKIQQKSYPSCLLPTTLTNTIGELVTVNGTRYVRVKSKEEVMLVSLNAGPKGDAPCRVVWESGRPVPIFELSDLTLVNIDAFLSPKNERMQAMVVWQKEKPNTCLQLLDNTYIFLGVRAHVLKEMCGGRENWSAVMIHLSEPTGSDVSSTWVAAEHTAPNINEDGAIQNTSVWSPRKGKKPINANDIVRNRLSEMKLASVSALNAVMKVEASCCIKSVQNNRVTVLVCSKYLDNGQGIALTKLGNIYLDATPITLTAAMKLKKLFWNCELHIADGGKQLSVPLAWRGRKPATGAMLGTSTSQPRQAQSTDDLSDTLNGHRITPPLSCCKQVVAGVVTEVLAEGGRVKAEDGRRFTFSIDACFLYDLCLHQMKAREMLVVGMKVEIEVTYSGGSEVVRRVWLADRGASPTSSHFPEPKLDSWCRMNGVSTDTRQLLMKEAELLSPSLFPTAARGEATTIVDISA
ncbi:hypothetical protein E2C01_040820 [Portunus trituberculatus]|uniref:Uncharacterized protein n=1 Tax=Portunus trituberculatus TaxID=210409 RepID=A0A5B7FRT3_PORTR|nr:hypothetical protein [Portunus trituberculatus]